MIPNLNHPKWRSLVKGEIKVHFKVFAGNMLLSHCQRKLARDTSSTAVEGCVAEAHAFFSKYENLYSTELLNAFGNY
jgi:hypothetical protein